MTVAAIDNDILLKGAGYGLLSNLILAIPAQIQEIGVLEAARFVVRERLGRAHLSDALNQFEEIIQQVEHLEPTEVEVRYAAQLEYEAQKENLSVDTGESQLCAIVMHRLCSWLVTGDKRAVRGLEALLSSRGDSTKLSGKVICLEQLILRLIQGTDASAIRSAVCTQAKLDRALTSCFSCSSPGVGPESWAEGLMSYVRDLRTAAPTILAT